MDLCPGCFVCRRGGVGILCRRGVVGVAAGFGQCKDFADFTGREQGDYAAFGRVARYFRRQVRPEPARFDVQLL